MKTLIALLLSAVAATSAWAGTTIDASHYNSYSANAGWMNWLADSSADGVVIGQYVCSGWVYSANLGWIDVGSGSPVNHIQYQNNSASDYGVNYTNDPTQPGYGILRGYAYAANIGWINFEPTGNPRISLFTGAFYGYAYSANVGWINLNDMSGDYVQTDQLAEGTDTNGIGIPDSWQYLYFGALLAPGEQNTDPNGNNMTLLQDYDTGVNPLTPNDGLKVSSFSTNPAGTTFSITFPSTTGRLYAIQVNMNIANASGWVDSGLGTFAPDPGTSTTRTVIEASATSRFFRVVTTLPSP